MARRYHYRKSYRARRKRSIFRNRFFWLAVFMLLFFGATADFAVFAPFFQIKEIKISGNQKITADEIKTIFDGKINKKIINYATKSIFLSNLSAIKEETLKKFPQIAEINIKRNFPDVLAAEIKERAPLGVWCQNSDCFYFDPEGIIFEKTEEQSSIMLKSEVENSQLKLGDRVIEKQYLEPILEINNNLKKNLELNIKEFIISQDWQKITVEIEEGWQIFFNLKGDVLSQVFNLDSVLKAEIPRDKRGNLQYIDLRFGNRVFLKYKD